MPRSYRRQQLDVLAHSLGYVIKGRSKDPRYSLKRIENAELFKVIWCKNLDEVEEVIMEKFNLLNSK